MSSRLLLVVCLVLVVCAHARASDSQWWVSLQASNETWIGAEPGNADGYDGNLPFDVDAIPGDYLNVFLYRQAGEGWTGPTGFYDTDFESPIPPGACKTWWDLYLWTKNTAFTPSSYLTVLPDGPRPPSGYWAKLVLDYVPSSLGWTGPMEYTISLNQKSVVLLPVSTVSDPLEGTRFHLTVYAPIPEPSFLLALLTGMASAGVA